MNISEVEKIKRPDDIIIISEKNLLKEFIIKSSDYVPEISISKMKLFDDEISKLEIPYKLLLAIEDYIYGILRIVNKYSNIVSMGKIKIKKTIFDWVVEDREIYLTIKKEEIIEDIINCMTRFYLLPIIVSNVEKKESHANILIVDKEECSIERFDPMGAMSYRENIFEYIELDKFFLDIYKTVSIALLGKQQNNKKFFTPIGAVYRGIQDIQSSQSDQTYPITLSTNKERSSLAWCLYYAELRIKFSNLTREQVLTDFMYNLTSNDKLNTRLCKFIRHYGNSVFLYMYKLLKNVKFVIKSIGSKDSPTFITVNRHVTEMKEYKMYKDEMLALSKIYILMSFNKLLVINEELFYLLFPS